MTVHKAKWIPWLTALFIIAGTVLVTWQDIPLNSSAYPVIDGKYYKWISLGDFSQVARNQSQRILHASTAGAVMRLFSMDIESAYFLTALLSLVLFTVTYTLFLQRKVNLPTPLAIPILFTPFLLQQFFIHYHPPDLFFAALLMLFLYQLACERLVPCFVLIVLLYLTREQTIFVSLPLLLMLFWRKNYQWGLVCLAATLIGHGLSMHFSTLGQRPNIHHLGDFIYLVGKLVFSSLYNILGIELYTNTYNQCTPLFTFDVPSAFPLGLITRLGLCGWNPWRALFTLNNFLTLFGLGPLILFLVFKKKRMALLREAPLWVLVSLGYGLLSFFITPIMATEPFRLAGYGWPAFWVAAPFLFRNHLYKGTKETVKILALHLLLAYLPTLLSVATESLSVHRLLVLGGTFLIYRTAWETLRESHSEDTVSSGRS